MKKLLFLIILTLLIQVTCKKECNNPLINEPTYFIFNGRIGTVDNSTIESFDNNLIICGNSGDMLSLIKISKSGNQIWRKDFTSGFQSAALAICENENKDIFCCGKTSRNWDNSRRDILLVKTNSEGDTIWTKTYGGQEMEYGSNIIKTSDGNILIAGTTDSFGASSDDIYLVKVNYNGDTIWTKVYADSGQEEPFHLIETRNGEYLVTGTNVDDESPREIYLIKISANGLKLWDKKIGPPSWKWGFSTIELSNEDLIICGLHTIGEGYSADQQVLVVKTDNLGNIIWEKEFGEDEISEIGNSLKQNLDGSFTITGAGHDVNTVRDDIILLKIDETGNLIWFKKFGSSKKDWGLNLIKDINDDNIITGDYNIGDNGGSIFFTKTDKDGNFK